MESLALAYVETGIAGNSSLGDARHVAAATVAVANPIVSWNFKHIVNRKRILLYNAINAREGYGTIEIYSPYELGEDDEG
jgi:hypothetical protein